MTDTFEYLDHGSLGAGSTRGDVPPAATPCTGSTSTTATATRPRSPTPRARSRPTPTTTSTAWATVTYSGATDPALDYQPLSVTYGYDGNGNLTTVVE